MIRGEDIFISDLVVPPGPHTRTLHRHSYIRSGVPSWTKHWQRGLNVCMRIGPPPRTSRCSWAMGPPPHTKPAPLRWDSVARSHFVKKPKIKEEIKHLESRVAQSLKTERWLRLDKEEERNAWGIAWDCICYVFSFKALLILIKEIPRSL